MCSVKCISSCMIVPFVCMQGVAAAAIGLPRNTQQLKANVAHNITQLVLDYVDNGLRYITQIPLLSSVNLSG